jgi:hypothetical protein
MVSMGDNENFPFMKCINILDIVVELLLRSTCPTLQSSTVFPLITSTSMCLAIFWLWWKHHALHHTIYSTSPTWLLHHPPKLLNSKWCLTIFSTLITFVWSVPHTKTVSPFHSTKFHFMRMTTFNTF